MNRFNKARNLAPAELNVQHHDDPVIGRCCDAWNRAHQAAKAAGINAVSCRLRGNEAFRAAMPALSEPANIPDFVACVAYGLMIGAICDPAGARLLYAAQVVTAAYKSISTPAEFTPNKQPKSEKNKPVSHTKKENIPPPLAAASINE